MIPTGPSPMTTTVDPGRDGGAQRAQVAGGEDVGEEDGLLVGDALGDGEREEVGERDGHGLGLPAGEVGHGPERGGLVGEADVGLAGQAGPADAAPDHPRDQHAVAPLEAAHLRPGLGDRPDGLVAEPDAAARSGASWYRCRSEPQMAVRSTVTMTPSGPGRTGSGTFSTLTVRGPSRTVARIPARYPAGLDCYGPNCGPHALHRHPGVPCLGHSNPAPSSSSRRRRRGHRRLLRVRGSLGGHRLERRRHDVPDRDPGLRRDLRPHGRAGRQAGLDRSTGRARPWRPCGPRTRRRRRSHALHLRKISATLSRA